MQAHFCAMHASASADELASGANSASQALKPGPRYLVFDPQSYPANPWRSCHQSARVRYVLSEAADAIDAERAASRRKETRERTLVAPVDGTQPPKGDYDLPTRRREVATLTAP
jgi:hypothetical protein